jgi:hypothetical protein
LPGISAFKTKTLLLLGILQISLQLLSNMHLVWNAWTWRGFICEMNGHKTIPELNKLGMVGYVEPVELTNTILYILTNKEEYFFVITKRIPL